MRYWKVLKKASLLFVLIAALSGAIPFENFLGNNNGQTVFAASQTKEVRLTKKRKTAVIETIYDAKTTQNVSASKKGDTGLEKAENTYNGGARYYIHYSSKATLTKGEDGYYYDGESVGGNAQAYSYEEVKDSRYPDVDKAFIIVTGVRKKVLPPKGISASEYKKEVTTGDMNSTNINLGNRPTVGVLLSEIFFTNGNDDGVKELDLSYNTIRKYPNPTLQSYLVDKSKAPTNIYYPNMLEKATTNRYEGNTLANILYVYAGNGFFQVNEEATKNGERTSSNFSAIASSYFSSTGALGFVVSPILLIFAGISSIVTFIIKNLIEWMDFGIQAVNYIVAILSPSWILNWGFGGSIEESDNPFVNAFNGVVKDFFGSNWQNWIGGTFKTIRLVASAVWLIGTSTMVIVSVGRRKWGNAFASIKKYWLYFTVPFLFVQAVIPSLASVFYGVSISDTGSKIVNTNRNEIDGLRLAVGTQGDIRVIYPDRYQKLLGTSKVDLKDFKYTSGDIEALNERLDTIIPSEVDAFLSETSSGETLTQTYNVNDYVNAISSDSSYSLPAANTPSTYLKWQDDGSVSVNATVIYPSNNSGSEVGDFLGDKLFYTGNVYIFTNQKVSKGEEAADEEDAGKSKSYAKLSNNSDVIHFSIPYSSFWKPTLVSRSKPWTYLYGVKQNNNAVTNAPTTYYLGTGNFLTSDLTKAYDKSQSSETIGSKYTYADIKGKVALANPSGTEKDGKTVPDMKMSAGGKDNTISKYWQMANAYTLALINKYQGTTAMTVNANNDDLVFSNQSMIFLLQSNLSLNKLKYYGTNVNYSDNDKAKSTSQAAMVYKRFITPQPTDVVSNQRIAGGLNAIALLMLSYGILSSVYTVGLGEIVIPLWKATKRIFFNASVSGILVYMLIETLRNVLFDWIPQVNNLGYQIIVKFTDSATSFNGFAGLASGSVAAFTSYMLIKSRRIAGQETSLVGITIRSLPLLVKALTDRVDKIDNMILGTNSSADFSGSDVPNVVDETKDFGKGRIKESVSGYRQGGAVGAVAGAVGAKKVIDSLKRTNKPSKPSGKNKPVGNNGDGNNQPQEDYNPISRLGKTFKNSEFAKKYPKMSNALGKVATVGATATGLGFVSKSVGGGIKAVKVMSETGNEAWRSTSSAFKKAFDNKSIMENSTNYDGKNVLENTTSKGSNSGESFEPVGVSKGSGNVAKDFIPTPSEGGQSTQLTGGSVKNNRKENKGSQEIKIERPEQTSGKATGATHKDQI